MQCPTCGTLNTRVIETRSEDGDTIIKRRHECGNLHRYNTYQIHETTARKVGLAQLRRMAATSAAGIAKRAASWLLRSRVIKLLAAGGTPIEAGKALGVSAERARQIRRSSVAQSEAKQKNNLFS